MGLVGLPERSALQLCSSSGELGGQFAHDSEETSCCSPVDIAQLTNQSDGTHLSGATFSRGAFVGRQLRRSNVGPDRLMVSAQANHRRHWRLWKSVSSSMVPRRQTLSRRW